MNDIKIVTPPDKVYGNSLKILVIHPSPAVRSELQDHLLNNDYDAVDVFMYNQSDEKPDIDWLLTVFHMSDIVIFDIDNSTPLVRDLASFLVSYPKTHWLTNATAPVYNHLSSNHVYDLTFMNKLRGLSEELPTESN